MRKYYNYAIDLGTTNSCIAKFDNGEVKVFKNIEGAEITPSAIYVNKNGRIVVGRRAIDKSFNEVNDTAYEFKRLMGIKHKHKFNSSNLELTPIELSSEVLKSLKEDVYRIDGDIVENVVITVPSAFNSIQCESTYESAKLAEFKNVILLQEPIAAALAYNIDVDNRDKKYVVFDLGGGTFDVAIVSIVDGRLNVINHEGDNFLGGKDIDRQILKDVILPEINKKFTMPEEQKIDETAMKRLLYLAEEAKKAISTMDEYLLDILDVGLDLNGNEIDMQINITSDGIDEAAMLVIERCIDITRKAIINAKLENQDIEEILLVGGGTYLPILRRELTDYFSVPVNSSEDPITVVVRGATKYASRLFIEDKLVEDNITVQLEYDNIIEGNSSNIMGKIINSEIIKQMKAIREDGGWDSNWINVIDNIFDIDLLLVQDKMNEFHIILKDIYGNTVYPANNKFEILSKKNSIKPTSPLLPYALYIEVYGTSEKLVKMISKNNPIPARKIDKFKTTRSLLPGTKDSLTIKIWEGESDNINLCEWVGNIYISGMDIIYPIPEGAELEIDISVDISRRINIDVYNEYSNLFKSGVKVYNQELLDINKPLSRIDKEIKNIIDELTSLKNYSGSQDKIDALLAQTFELSLENFTLIKSNKLDKDSIMWLLGKVKDMRLKLENIKNSSKDNIEIDEKEEDENKRNKINVFRYGSTEDKEEYQRYENLLTTSIEEKDKKGAKIYFKKMEELSSKVSNNNIDYWHDIFKMAKNLRLHYTNINEADIWILKCEEAKENNDLLGLQNGILVLYGLLDKKDIDLAEEQFLNPDISKL